jgi:excisionase family DNA binding protein
MDGGGGNLSKVTGEFHNSSLKISHKTHNLNGKIYKITFQVVSASAASISVKAVLADHADSLYCQRRCPKNPMANQNEKNPDFCSTSEAAELLGVSLRTVQLWVESGVLKAWKTAGGHRRVVRSTVDALLGQRDQVLLQATTASKFRILVVEDESDLRRLYQMTLASWDLPIEVVTASDGFEGLVQIGASRPDMVISDLNMPGMDGFRMIRNLMANPEYQSLNMAVVTALSEADIADRGGLPEGVTVFPKPVPFSKLEALVKDSIKASPKMRNALNA